MEQSYSKLEAGSCSSFKSRSTHHRKNDQKEANSGLKKAPYILFSVKMVKHRRIFRICIINGN